MCDCNRKNIEEAGLDNVLAGGGLHTEKTYYERIRFAAQRFKELGYCVESVVFYYDRPRKSLNFCAKSSYVESSNLRLLAEFF